MTQMGIKKKKNGLSLIIDYCVYFFSEITSHGGPSEGAGPRLSEVNVDRGILRL